LVPDEDFEDDYTSKFEQRFRPRGLAIRYARDRAATDVGMHLRTAPGSIELSGVRVWFQLKGKRATTYTREQFEAVEPIAVSVELDHLRFWYAGGEATYLVVYLESVDVFVAEDTRDVVDRMWGVAFLETATFPADQRTVTVKLSPSWLLTDDMLDRMLHHRTMRIDGPAFRGRPLGHRLDPLRCELAVLDPDLFESVTGDLLAAHDYRVERQLDPGLLLAGVGSDGHRATLTVGTLHTTWEWVFQMGTEFGYGEDSMLRDEGQVFRAFGRTAVLAHSGVNGPMKAADTAGETTRRLKDEGVDHLLVLTNAPDRTAMTAGYRFMGGELGKIPEGLGSLAYNVLSTTLVYLKYQGDLRWKMVHYLY